VDYLKKICARRAKKTPEIYRTIAFTRLIPHFGEKPLDTIRSCGVQDFMATMLGECSHSESTTRRFERFRSLKPVFVVAIETGVRKMDRLSLEWTQVDLDGFIRLLMKKTRKWAVVPISQLCRQALDECRARRVMSRYVLVNHDGTRVARSAKELANAKIRAVALL
jgi:integrase